jgi:hypothetical protein
MLRQIRSNFALYKKRKLGLGFLLLTAYPLIFFILGLVLIIPLWLGYTDNSEFEIFVDVLFDSYSNINLYLSELGYVLLGSGLHTYFSDVGMFVVSYGVVGCIVILFFLMHVSGKAFHAIAQDVTDRNSLSLPLNFVLALALFLNCAGFVIGNLDILTFFVFINLLVLIYSMQAKSFENIRGAVSDLSMDNYINFSKVSEKRLLAKILRPKVWQEIFQSLRIILVVALLILSPSILSTIIDLF